ncbi:CDP-glucose 4,6-dehydratase [Pseudodesulfovibrio mercurii]|uniref:CDP-glucose 4,6-dehydratase n=1 Tax=Pseudodesulfovibrio mercurii TaxID=641491 RepID=F0JID4_9BACT|nr:CDP-glucose 4,6-dehydratase [Pseudodesulfovibrio mercurii]EGB14186.1 CDP-glucose 4,6-dehydratase [Pseudodesulfovibrio mercurii]
MSPFSDFYQGRKVFLTGHTGFKGAWLALWLHSLGAEVTGYSLAAPSEPNLFEAAGVAKRIRHVAGDILDAERLERAMAESRPEVVFHLAARGLVLDAYDRPMDTLRTNVIGSANVLEAVRRTDSVRALVSVSSDKCYDNREQPWGYRETDPLGGHDPYSASKGAMEIVCDSWNRSFFIPEGRVGAATARAGNVLGGGDFGAHRLVPDYVRAVRDGHPLEVRMPHAVRPWQHVLEPLSGYLWLAVKLARDPAGFAGPWNFAPLDNACSVETLVETIHCLSGMGSWRDVSDRGRGPHEAGMLKLCGDKAALYLQWKGVLELERTVDMTMRGYGPFLGRALDAGEVCLGQIDEYTAIAARKGRPWAL